MNRSSHSAHGAGGGSGLQALNTANLDERLDALLQQYFRHGVSPTPSGAGSKRRKRPHSDADESTPATALRAIKAFLKSSREDKHIRRAFDAITHQLHKAKRCRPLLPLAVQLATELFARSSVLRGLVASQAAAFFSKLLEAAGEKDLSTKRRRVAGFQQQSDEVRLVLTAIEQWTETFGARYPTLVAGHAGLHELGYAFPHAKERATDAQTAQTERIHHQTAVRALQLQKMEREMEALTPEMETTMTEMDSIFEILVPTLEAFELEECKDAGASTVRAAAPPCGAVEEETGAEDEDDAAQWAQVPVEESTVDTDEADADPDADADDGDGVEWEDVAEEEASGGEQDQADDDSGDHMDINDIVQAYGLGSSSYQLTISIPTNLCEQSSENEVLFRNLVDGVLQIRKRFLPLVGHWLQIADADAVALGKPRDAALVQRLLELRARLDAVTLKWEDLARESERKRFARIQPRVVSLPLAVFGASKQQQQRSKQPSKRRRLRCLL